LPTPLTPTKVMLYGVRPAEDVDAVAEKSLLRIERRRSVDDFGVNMRVRVVDRAACTSDLIPMQKVCEGYTVYIRQITNL
jgi:hypothetical protein